MNIDLAIMSSDDNALYLDFWPIVSKLWKKRFNITPILLHFGTKDVSTEYGQVIRPSIQPDVPLYLQCTCSRLWYTCYMPAGKTAIVSDIDMLPLSPWYFQKQIAEVSNDVYVHLNPCIETYGHLAMCYNVAQGSVYQDVLKLPSDWVAAARFFKSVKPIRGHTAERPLWFVDETILTERVLKYSGKSRIVLLKRPGGQNGHRIDRPHCNFDRALLKKGDYYDCHSVRPFEQHKDLIREIAGEKK